MTKTWSAVLFELEKSISRVETIEDANIVLNRFISIDEAILDGYAPNLYLEMCKIALKAGKLSIANSYAKKILQYLIKYKRIPQLKQFIQRLYDVGISKKRLEEYAVLEDIILGKKNKITSLDLKNFDFFLYHPERFKQSPEFIKQYLLAVDDWSQDAWKLCYEFILFNHFDKDIFQSLLEKAKDLKNKKYERRLLALFDLKKIKIRCEETIEVQDEALAGVIEQQKLNIDYDQIAMDLISGYKDPTEEDQKRVITSLKYMTEDELLLKGKEMIVAFELLGMEQVVLSLCEKVIKKLTDPKERASIFYMWVQAFINTSEFHKAIDLVDEVIQFEPLYGEEILAFLYVKAEACLKINRKKIAKNLYMEIKKQNPCYRLVRERLKILEAT